MSTVFKRLLPTLNRVLVRKIEPQTKTASGIILQKGQDNTNTYGVIVEVGPGFVDEKGNHIKLNLNIGDHVLLPEYGGTKVKLQEAEFLLYKDTDILAKMEK
jgi:chaperonin GroES